jgi:putative spermidine/putrescine transport system permease protein
MGSVRPGTVACGTLAEIEALASQVGQSIHVEPIDLPQAAVEVRRPEPPRWLRSLPLPLLPFLIFCILLEIVPVIVLIRDSLREQGFGAFTLANYLVITDPLYARALRNSVLISLGTALLGALIGGLTAAAIVGGSERGRRWSLGLVAVTSNFGGIPLSFAFVALLGTNGFITLLLREWIDLKLYPGRFSLYSWTGLTMVYFYFQLPLMVLIFTPAIARLKPVWREAAATLGASTWYYWWRVGLRVMAAPFIAAIALLFANALGAYATAYALVGGNLNILPIQIGYYIEGDLNFDPGKASALSLILAVLMALGISVAYTMTQRAQRWLS